MLIRRSGNHVSLIKRIVWQNLSGLPTESLENDEYYGKDMYNDEIVRFGFDVMKVSL